MRYLSRAICSNQKVLKGYNDFATIYPELSREWDYEKNGYDIEFLVFKSDDYAKNAFQANRKTFRDLKQSDDKEDSISEEDIENMIQEMQNKTGCSGTELEGIAVKVEGDFITSFEESVDFTNANKAQIKLDISVSVNEDGNTFEPFDSVKDAK